MNLLQMSVSGALLILGVVLIRLAALRAVPKRTFLFLWALVLVRLLVPFPPLLPLPSLLPEGLFAPAAATAVPAAQTAPISAANASQGEQTPRPAYTPAPAQTAAPAPQASHAPASDAPAVTAMPHGAVTGEPQRTEPGGALSPRMASIGSAALIVWLLGLCITAAVFAILYIVSYRRFRRASSLEGPEAEAWLETHPIRRRLRLRTLPGLTSPLTYGILRPVILLPEGLDLREEGAAYALEHEYVHTRRLDALWKLLLALTLAVHWFNPFVWLLWFLANRDLELSCDEEVLRRFGTEQRGDYARALLAMEEKRSLLPPLHSGFGSGATKERILSIMKYKKATVLSISLAAVLVAVLAACALGGADKPKETPEPTFTPSPTAAPTPAPTALGAPGTDLTVGPVRWGMTPEEVRRAFTDTKGDVGPVSADGKITLSAEFCSCPAEISWCFADDGNGLFLNGIEVLFTDAETFDREAVAIALEESWGERCKYERANKYSPGVDGPNIAPREDWYWRTADFSDEYGWKSGVTARFTTSEAVYTLSNYRSHTSPEPAGAPLLRIDATGRSQAEGRLTTLPRTEETKWEVDRLMGLATRIRPSAASWEYFDPEYMHSDDGSGQASVRVYTPRDRDLAEKLFDPYSWLTVDYRGDQFDPADTSDILLDGSLVPTVSVFTPEAIFEEGWEAVFTNRTEEDLTLLFPVGLLAERDGVWVRPRFHYDGTYDYIAPTLAPGESYTFDCQFELRHACYDLAPGRYMLTMAATQGGRQLTYGAEVWITDGPAPKDGEASIPFESGGYTLSIPAEYWEALTVEAEKMTDYWELLFTVTEKASYEAGQKLHPGEDWGDGWLFSIARISEDELGKLMMWDMSGVDAFAREQSGDYLLLLRPTDVRFIPNGENDEARMQQWEAMQDWTWASMPERFLEDNAGLASSRHGGSFVENALARVLYYDPAEYGEKGTPSIRYGDGEGLDPLGTPQAREDARKLLWGYRFDGAATAADFPQKGMTVTVTDPLGCELTFREGSDVVAVANVSTDVRYLRMVPDTEEMKGHNIGDWACRWYFHASAALSGQNVTVKNGKYTLSLPWEDAEALYVETPEVSEDLRSLSGDETIFRVSEKASKERWDSLTERSVDTADGWYFTIQRMWPHDLGRAYVAGGSGWSVFARDEQGTFYTYDYPIWLTFCPEAGQEPEGEALQRYWALYRALGEYGIEDRFIADNGLQPFSFNAMRGFLCFTLYDDTALAEATLRADGKAYPAEWVRNPLSELLWDAELTEIQAPAAAPKETIITLERNGVASLAFWPESDLCLMSSWTEEHWYRGGGDKAAAALEMAREIAAREERINAALPERSGRTADYVSRGVTLSLPEEYAPYLIVETPESGSELFRVSQRSSWENGQKLHPGEDWGDGWLFSLDRFDEETFLWEVRAHPTPTEYVAKDGEGGYYILRYPSDVRYVGQEDGIIESSDENLFEWQAWCRWSQGLAEEHVVSGADLTAFHKSFCYLETVLAAYISDYAWEGVSLRFPDGDGREIDVMAAPEWEDIARQLLTECSSYASSEGTGGGNGQLIELVVTLPYDHISQIAVIFTEGSLYFEEVVDYTDRQSTSRTYRMSFSGTGETVGDLMARWYREAVQNGG